jgi:hypothetical protein
LPEATKNLLTNNKQEISEILYDDSIVEKIMKMAGFGD